MKYIKISHLLFFKLLLLSGFTLFAQNSVLINSNEFGQGLLRSKGGKCYLITAKHIIEDYYGTLNLVGPYNVRGQAKIAKTYSYDLAILEITNGDFECNQWLDITNLDVTLESTTDAAINLRNEYGDLQPIAVTIVAKGDEKIIVKSKNSNQPILPGMSGGSLVMNGVEVGILLNTDLDTGLATILRKDLIARITEPFFEGRKLVISKRDLNLIAESVLNFQFKSNYISISEKKIKGAIDYVDQIWIGNTPEKLDLQIDLYDIGNLNINGYLKFPIALKEPFIFGRVKFKDGTFSALKKIKCYEEINYVGKALTLESEEQTEHVNPVYLYTNISRKNKPLIVPVTPMHTIAVRYKFDDGGFFEMSKQSQFSNNFYGLFQIEVPFDADHITLEYVLEDQIVIGPYRYKKEDLEALVKNKYKTDFEAALETNFSCYRIPAMKHYEIPREAPKSQEELRERTRKQNWSISISALISNYLGMSFNKIIDDNSKMVCVQNFAKRVTVSPVMYTAVKAIHFGTSPDAFETTTSIDLDLEECLDSASKCRKTVSDQVCGILPFKDFSSDVYIQFHFFDDAISRVYRIKVDPLFDKYFKD